MGSVLVQTLIVSGVGLTMAALTVLVRGLPTLPESAVACTAPTAENDPQWLAPTEAHAYLDRPDVVFLDARSRDAFQSGHIPGSKNSPVSPEAPVILPWLPPDATVICYCDTDRSCSKSMRLAEAAAAAGFTPVFVLEGGFAAWLDEGLPAQSGL